MHTPPNFSCEEFRGGGSPGIELAKAKGFRGKCFRCGVVGHRRDDCPNESAVETDRSDSRGKSRGRGRGKGKSDLGGGQGYMPLFLCANRPSRHRPYFHGMPCVTS